MYLELVARVIFFNKLILFLTRILFTFSSLKFSFICLSFFISIFPNCSGLLITIFKFVTSFSYWNSIIPFSFTSVSLFTSPNNSSSWSYSFKYPFSPNLFSISFLLISVFSLPSLRWHINHRKILSASFLLPLVVIGV